jgi:hypothetical protein
MDKNGFRIWRTALLAGVALTILATAGAAQARVGITSQTTNNPLGTPPQQQQRTLKVGIDVFANERIQTTANDRAHLLFLDGSSLTVGPNSDLMIDKFVYDPNSGKGELAVSATKGIFRLVGGKITKSNEATIKVGTSTIGIRGGITIVNAPECPPGAAAANCQAEAYFMFGQQLTVTNPDGSQSATRPGTLIAFGAGGPPNPPVVAPPNSLVGPIGQLEAPAGTGNTGPAGIIEQKTAGLPPTNSALPLIDPASGAPQPAQMATNTTGATSNQGTQPDPNNPQQPPEGSPPPTTVTTVISAEGRFLREEPFNEASFNAFGATAGRDPDNNVLLQSAAVTTSSGPIITLVTDPGTLTVTTANGFSFTVPWNPGAGDFAFTANPAGIGAVEGFGFVSPNGDFYMYRMAETANDRQLGFFGGDRTPTGGLPTTGFSSREFFTLDGGATKPFLPDMISAESVVANANIGLAHIAWAPVPPTEETSRRATWFQASLNIQGQGDAQSSFLSIATGVFAIDDDNQLYAAGGSQTFIRKNATEGPIKYLSPVASAETQNGSAIYGPGGEYMVLVPERITTSEGTTRTPSVGFSLPFDTLEVTDVYYPVVGSRPATAPADLGAVRTTETLTGFTGALVENNNGGWMSSYAVYNTNPANLTITKDAASNRVAGLFTMTTGAPPADEIVLQWGSLSGSSQQQQSAFIDDKRFAMREANPSAGTFNGEFIVTQMSMVTATAVDLPTSIVPAGVTICECQYLTWGYWQADLNYQEGPRAGQRDYVTLGTWVAGRATADIDMPLDGTATFSGHIIGNVENNAGNSYVAVGSYSNAWDFGSRTGDLTITNFDGANYAGTTTGVVGTGRFNGSFSGTSANALDRSGSLWGAHFDAPGADGKAAYQAGSFRLNSGESNYKASGTFSSQRGAITPPVITTLSAPPPKTN